MFESAGHIRTILMLMMCHLTTMKEMASERHGLVDRTNLVRGFPCNFAHLTADLLFHQLHYTATDLIWAGRKRSM